VWPESCRESQREALVKRPPLAQRSLDLNERLISREGTYYFSGMQALVRLPLEQIRRDREAGLSTGAFITGYPGSPLAGYDLALERVKDLLRENNVLHVPGSSEERSVTSLMGTQMIDGFPHANFDGVVGFFYGKGPGVDRSGDALKHGNFAGTSRHGAVVVLSGEDHEASSSTMPFQEDQAFVAAGIPILAPSSVQEIYELGLHAVGLSRYSGCWVALKLPTALCDSGATFEVGPDHPSLLPIPELPGFEKRTDFKFFPGTTLGQERHLYRERHLAALHYARSQGLNKVYGPRASTRSRLGIVTSGKSFGDVREAFARLGASLGDLEELGISLLVYSMTYPFDAELVRHFATSVDRILVVEEKREFMETGLRAALHEGGLMTQVWGKHDPGGQELFPVEGGFDADRILISIGSQIFAETRFERPLSEALARINASLSRNYPKLASRTPNYCSGCPHNTSTLLPKGAVAWGSPGCHSFASIIEQPERHIEAMTQYGGEGLPWIGLAPFVDRPHIFQNVGDGSIFHSSYENIRACIAAGVSITFKILYNGAVANTGAQTPVGQLSVATLVHMLEMEGVSRVAVVTKDPSRYAKAGFGSLVSLHLPDEMVRVQGELEKISGVTVLIYDESCANERRRQQKRGRLPIPTRHVFINERVCESCGDCGRVSNCMSLVQVQTPLGSKTQVHASSCNQDESCLRGDCPSFVTVESAPGTGYRKPSAAEPDLFGVKDPVLPEPGAHYAIYLPGLGGTGVITANAILATAAWLDGRQVVTYDQTGAAQKWGPVLSSLVISDGTEPPATAKVGAGGADLYLALDLVAAADPRNLSRCQPGVTKALVNLDVMATGEVIRNRKVTLEESAMLSSLKSSVGPEQLSSIPARRIAEELMGDYLMTNMVMLGAAYQAGLLPITEGSIQTAIEANGAAVAQNLAAWKWGRLWIARPGQVEAAIERANGKFPKKNELDALAIGPLARKRLARVVGNKEALSGMPQELRELVYSRARDLLSYQDLSWAGSYLDFVASVASLEQRVSGDRMSSPGWELTKAVAVGLHKLMSYKDEYEVARLYLLPSFARQLSETFEAPKKVTYHLHPPVLRSLGMRRKIKLGPWFRHVFRVLYQLRRLRGTSLDPFGRAELRKQERAAIEWYKEIVNKSASLMDGSNKDLVVEIASLPTDIRGYEKIKLDSLAEARARADLLMKRLQEAEGRLSKEFSAEAS
jgi:indolepyruvate ferredoxin oxidoreductase